MFEGKIYKIMIGCPSDIQQEVDTIKSIISEWNSEYSELFHVVLLPKHWKTDAYPLLGKHPQKHINEQIVTKSDLLICIFGARLGSPTDTSISGSVEEIEEHRKAGKPVMVFFRKKNESQGWEQMKAIEEFKENKNNEGLWWDYDDESSFGKLFSNKLTLFLNDYWLKDNIIDLADNNKKYMDASERRLKLENLLEEYQTKISTSNYQSTEEMVKDVTAEIMARIQDVLSNHSQLFIRYGNNLQQLKGEMDDITKTLTSDNISKTGLQTSITKIYSIFNSIKELIVKEIQDTYSS